jgi:predicted DNA-binding transcriptional regulator YafY
MLVHLSGRWHLAAYCRLRQAPRFFRLDRIDRFDPLGEQFILSERHQMTPDSGQPADLPEARVRFDLSVARWVRERQPYTFQREELTATGLLCVYALRDEGELLAWLLGWGAAVEVLSPSSLRARLVAEARALLARHGEDRN